MTTPNFLPAGVTVLAASVLGFLSPLLFLQRNIGGFIADVTISEHHTDEMAITENPVERGADITDHAYKRPSSVVIRAGWSNSSLSALINPFYVQTIYAQFLALQRSAQPFSITTGKRVYDNMLIRRMTVETDEKSENALLATFECQEILLADTQVVTSAPASSMKDPESTSSTSDRGAVGTKPLENAAVSGGGGAPKRIDIRGGTFDQSIQVPAQ